MVDAISVQVIRNRISSIMQEMHYHFYRSGYSTIIRESKDFSCVILDSGGGLLVAPSMFLHAPVYRHLVRKLVSLYGEAGLRDGDVFVSNHPYEGGLPHVSDMAFIAPIFSAGALIGFSGSIAHKADVGGTVPGSTSASATEMFHEGLLLPPVRMVAAGVLDEDLRRVILANTRQRDLVNGDMNAQIAATQMGVRRMQDVASRFGAAAVVDAFGALIEGAAAQLRAAVASLPNGVASAEGFMDNDGIDRDQPVRFACTVTVRDGMIEFDFTKSNRQTRGPMNLRPSMVEACVFYCLIGVLDPRLQYSDGMRDVVRFRYAPDTVTNASPPSAVSSYQTANHRLVDVILEALAHFRPERAVANSGASGALSIAWRVGRPGQPTMQYEILGSAYGGGQNYDGASALSVHLSNLHITPIEILESEFPCRITCFDMVVDSAGPGEFRGGIAFRRGYELLQDAVVVRRYDRSRFPPKGVSGGKAGQRSRFVLHPGTDREQEMPAAGRYELAAGDTFLLQAAGGGGFGDPLARDRAAVARDIAEGYVSRASARRDYGWTQDEDEAPEPGQRVKEHEYARE